MRFLLIGLLLLGTLAGTPVAAQASNSTATSINELPGWLIDFSNLPKETQQEYIAAFQAAKAEYAAGNWIICCAYLNECEFIFRGNPHVWNLRATCLIEQKNLDEAEEMLNKARRELPHDETTIMNLANLYMAREEYALCIDTLSSILQTLNERASAELLNVLVFRIYLCRLMLGQQQQAADMVKHLNPLSDTPLYYFSQAALHISKGNRKQATEDINAASAIFSQNNAILPYIRSIRSSGIEDKFLSDTP